MSKAPSPEAYSKATRPPYSLILKKKSGEIISYSYAYLARVLFTRSTVFVEFGKHVVEITGSGLEQLAIDIARHEVDTVVEDGRNSGMPEVKVVEIKLPVKT